MSQSPLMPADPIRVSAPAHPSNTAQFVGRALLVLILLSSFLLKLHHLDHAALKGLDESFHALVAKNFLKHPFTPTLIDQPYLPYDYRDWQANHIWLHKPPVPLWQIALSYLLFGITPLALRLPSAILATASVYLTYAIGRRLLSQPAGLIAAALQAFNPALTQLVQGYIFSDHVDVALLFWTELSIYLLVLAAFEPCPQADATEPTARPARRRMFLLAACGIATGIAFLCKTYPAFITLLLAFVLVFLNRSLPGAISRSLPPWRSSPLFPGRSIAGSASTRNSSTKTCRYSATSTRTSKASPLPGTASSSIFP